MAIQTIAESGLIVCPPTTAWFRFQDCASFQPLKKVGVAEMDVGFVAADGKQRWLVELRDFSHSGNPDGFAVAESVERMQQEFVTKAKDSLLVLGSMWHSLPYGPQLAGDIPSDFQQRPTEANRLRLAFVVKTDEPRRFRASVQPIQDKLRNRIQGQPELLGVRRFCDVFLWDHEMAIESGLPIAVNDAAKPSQRATKALGLRG